VWGTRNLRAAAARMWRSGGGMPHGSSPKVAGRVSRWLGIHGDSLRSTRSIAWHAVTAPFSFRTV
jgi:hypothetical protein